MTVVAKRLTKRTIVKEPEPVEPYTTLVEGPEPVIEKSEPLLGMCIQCGICPADSWVDKLCYRCHRLAAGFVFDPEQKRYVKSKGKVTKA